MSGHVAGERQRPVRERKKPDRLGAPSRKSRTLRSSTKTTAPTCSDDSESDQPPRKRRLKTSSPPIAPQATPSLDPDEPSPDKDDESDIDDTDDEAFPDLSGPPIAPQATSSPDQNDASSDKDDESDLDNTDDELFPDLSGPPSPTASFVDWTPPEISHRPEEFESGTKQPPLDLAQSDGVEAYPASLLRVLAVQKSRAGQSDDDFKIKHDDDGLEVWCACEGPEGDGIMLMSEDPECSIRWYHVGCIADLEYAFALEFEMWLCQYCWKNRCVEYYQENPMRFPNLDPSVWRKLSLLSTTDMLTLFAKINGAVDLKRIRQEQHVQGRVPVNRPEFRAFNAHYGVGPPISDTPLKQVLDRCMSSDDTSRAAAEASSPSALSASGSIDKDDQEDREDAGVAKAAYSTSRQGSNSPAPPIGSNQSLRASEGASGEIKPQGTAKEAHEIQDQPLQRAKAALKLIEIPPTAYPSIDSSRHSTDDEVIELSARSWTTASTSLIVSWRDGSKEYTLHYKHNVISACNPKSAKFQFRLYPADTKNGPVVEIDVNILVPFSWLAMQMYNKYGREVLDGGYVHLPNLSEDIVMSCVRYMEKGGVFIQLPEDKDAFKKKLLGICHFAHLFRIQPLMNLAMHAACTMKHRNPAYWRYDMELASMFNEATFPGNPVWRYFAMNPTGHIGASLVGEHGLPCETADIERICKIDFEEWKRLWWNVDGKEKKMARMPWSDEFEKQRDAKWAAAKGGA